MLISELKKNLKNYDDNKKEEIILELYKRIPKKVKENYDIDNYIINGREKISKNDEVIPFATLKSELTAFLENVYDGYYASPNRIISKNERSKWRFKVKKYYNALNNFSPDTPDGREATELLIELFELLSDGTHTLKFSNWNTFGAIKVSQSSFLETIMKRKLVMGYTKENISECVKLLDIKYDPNEYHFNVYASFFGCLKTIDTKYMAIEELKILVDHYKNKLVKSKEYDDEIKVNYFTEYVTDLYFSLVEIENGIKYFKNNYQVTFRTIEETILNVLEDYDYVDEWICEYEKSVDYANHEERIQKKYERIKKTKSFSSTME